MPPRRKYGAPKGPKAKISKETFLTALSTGRTIGEIAKLYAMESTTFYRWLRKDEAFKKRYDEITSTPLYLAKRKATTRGTGVISDEDKPRWAEAFVAYFRENEGRIVDACKHVGISYKMYKEAMDPAHPSFEPWFSDAIKEIEEEHEQAMRDEVRVQAKKSPTMMKYLLGLNGTDDDESAANLDDASILRILQQLKMASEGEDANGTATGQPEQVPEIS